MALCASGSAQTIDGLGIRLSLNQATNVYSLSVPNGADYQIDSGNLATKTSGVGPLTLQPEYTPPLSFAEPRLWDIEQVVSGAPVNERYVPQYQRGGPSDWETSILRPTLSGSPPVLAPNAGNPQPGVTLGTAPDAGTANTTINNGVAYEFALEYIPNATPFTGGLIFTSINGQTIGSGATVPGRLPTDPSLFSDLTLRVAISAPPTGTRTLSLTNLQLQTGTLGTPELMRAAMDGSVVSTFTASAEGLPGGANRVREYAFWDDVISDTTYFRLVGSATWSFPAGDDPQRAAMAFQFKVGGPFSVIPEPAAYIPLLGALGLVGAALARRFRKSER